MYERLALDFPMARMQDETATAKFLSFCADLSHLPHRFLTRAVERYRLEPAPDGKAKFFPQSQQLIGLCEGDVKESAALLRGIEEMERVLSAPSLPKPGDIEPITAARAREIRENIERMGAANRPAHPVASKPTRPINTARPESTESAAELRANLAAKTAT
jgi:hypothetical protein